MSETAIPERVLPSEPPGPITASERVHVADVLRGFAVLGILLVNMRYFNTPIQLELVGEPVWSRPIDVVFTSLVQFFAEGKFFVLFSFLFGWGFSVLLERLESRGANAVRLYRRRVAVLLAIGALHIVLLWFGDILFIYALLGFTLPWFRRKPDRSLRRWIVALLVLPLVLQGMMQGLGALGAMDPQAQAREAEQMEWFRGMGARAMEVYAEGSFGEIVVQRLADYGFSLFGWALLGGVAFQVLALFLLGLYAGRRRWLHDVTAHEAMWKTVFRWGLPIGLVASSLYVWGMAGERAMGTARGVSAMVGMQVGGPTLSAAYVAALILVMRRDAVREGFVGLLAPVGRMALTNYLMQSVICTTIFFSYGLGLYGRVSPGWGLALALVIFAVQIVTSRAWLARFRYGPAEWAWRALTYGTRPPMRR
jgi:uncharacterized protein